ncbi:MAG: hypothetical protein KIT16_08905 [Rhodospirillaceae bacterium]|nr:hypothetical protein [Rhodospirillaceae bacterium]
MNSTKTVAVIDRDRITAFALALLLRDWGYDAVSGDNAPDLFGRTEAAGLRIAAIVADDRPDAGTTGPAEAATLADMAGRTIPTIVLADPFDPAAAAQLAARGMAVVAKPAEPLRLREILRSATTLA